MKRIFCAAIAAMVSSMALVGPASAAPGDELPELYFSGSNPHLTAQEQQVLAIAKRWQEGGATAVPPAAGPNGSIQFVYGAQQPVIVCAVLQVCDVALQPGERVNGSIHLGDKVRWSVEPAITGSGSGEIEHLIIKPQDVGLETSLVVTTDRRTYHLKLRSHRTQYMPHVTFVYPEDVDAKWAAIQQRADHDREQRTLPHTGEYLGDLSFDYRVAGKASWKPVRVYNDGRKTIIEMPEAMQQTEAPTLLVVRREGGSFSDDETVMVNYRVQGNRYIVDTVFDKAILIAGVGKRQDRITISRGK